MSSPPLQLLDRRGGNAAFPTPTRLIPNSCRVGCFAVAAALASICGCSKEGTNALGGTAVRVSSQEPPDPLESGDRIPTFEAIAHTGQLVSPEQYRGRPLALCFCGSVVESDGRQRADALRARWPRFRDADAGVLGVFRDEGVWLRTTAYDLKLPYLALSDDDGRVARAFGLAARDGELAMPSAFVADQKGKIVEVVTNVAPKRMAEEIVNVLPSADS